MNTNRSTLLATAVALALTAPVHSAFAQSGQDDESSLEEIVVTGIRGSMRESVETKREASAIVDAITAQDIGKFPDKNVAESLSHIPGINIDRQFGQGERISIRGTDPALNRTLLNGQTVASADWFILDVPGRTFNYTLLAPQIVQSIEVYKSPMARLDEGSIGGTVILRTRRPLDLPANSLRASIDYAYNDRAEDGAPNFSGLYSWKNDGETFGVLVTLLSSEEQLERHGLEFFSYPSAVGAGFDPALVGNDPSVVFPNAVNAAFFQQERTRDTGTLSLQLRPSDSFELNFTGLLVNAQYDNYNQSRYAFIGHGASAPNVTSATVENGVVTAADLSSGLTLLDAIVRKSEVEMNSLTLRGDWYGDDWTGTAVVGSTEADGGTGQQYFLEYQGFGGYSYTVGEASAAVNYASGNDPSDPSSLPEIGFGQSRQQPTHDEEQYLQLDFTQELGWGAINQLLVGIDFRQHETSQEARLANIISSAFTGLGLGDFNGGPTPDGFLGGVDSSPDLQNWLTVDRSELGSFVSGAPLFNVFTGAPVSSLPAFPSAAFNVEEDITSGYAQFDFSGEGFRGNVGLRVVQTDQTSSGAIQQGGPGVFVSNSVSKDYTDWLPSFNVAFDIQEDLILRLAASRTLARANFSDLASYLELLDTINSGSGGNPNLDPYRSANFDASVEWYFDEGELLSVAAFYKDIRSFIVREASPEEHFNILTGQVETYSVTRPRNGAGGEIRGVEVAYQASLRENFGVQASYTFADGGTDEGLEIPFSSKHSVSFTPYYDDGRLNARVTYGWRSKYFRQIGRNGVAVTNDDYGQLDLSIGYYLTDNIEITAQALNLLDETTYQYAGVENRPLAIYNNGRRYFVGLRFAL